jgi:MoaA/NifB/PqqE/SkfB family radical SAM enzyme
MLTNLALIVTTRCDYHCAHCLRDLSDEKVDFLLELLPKLLEQARPFGARHVGFTGGEPHLHPHFAELVEMV